jgi:4-diphosphocytidyl-2-C-methyl-D-erythritol kinase
MANDLEPVAFKLQPRLQEFKDRMEAAGAAKVYMSGSGPTLLAMADSQEAAEEMAAALRLELTDVEMVRAVKTVPRGLEILKFD